MRPRDLHEVIAYAPAHRLRALAEAALDGADAEIAHGPESGLIMVRVLDTVDDAAFNLGEVLVTRCEVVRDGCRGWAMVLGHEPRRALHGAVLDAAARDELELGLARALQLELKQVHEARRARWRDVQATRVDFEELSP
jgi:alpha-D-ribose 1-methylphosphonate 5-triphosphate synthase subunit PhnG